MLSMFFKGFAVIILTTTLTFSEVDVNYKIGENTSMIDCHEQNIDSLKWIMYSLNFEQKAKHYKYDSLSEMDIVECNLILSQKDTSISDTIIYWFSFFKDKEYEPYNTRGLYPIAIGYSCPSKNLFSVVSGHFFPTYNGDPNYYKNLFYKQEKKFIKYLKKYKRPLAPWLKAEAVRRKVLPPQ